MTRILLTLPAVFAGIGLATSHAPAEPYASRYLPQNPEQPRQYIKP